MLHDNIHYQFPFQESGVTFEPSIVPINSSNGVIEFQFMGSTDDVDTPVEFSPFFIPDQVRVCKKHSSDRKFSYNKTRHTLI